MPSASANAKQNDAIDIRTGSYRVVTTVLEVQSAEREELHNLTPLVRSFVRTSGVRDSIVTIFSLHTTNAVFINEWQDALIHDAKALLDRTISKDLYYRHNDPAWSD